MSENEGALDEAWYDTSRVKSTGKKRNAQNSEVASARQELVTVPAESVQIGCNRRRPNKIPTVLSEEPGHISLFRLKVNALRPTTEKFTSDELAHLKICRVCKRNHDLMTKELWHPAASMLKAYLHSDLMLADLELVFTHVAEHGCEQCIAALYAAANVTVGEADRGSRMPPLFASTTDGAARERPVTTLSSVESTLDDPLQGAGTVSLTPVGFDQRVPPENVGREIPVSFELYRHDAKHRQNTDSPQQLLRSEKTLQSMVADAKDYVSTARFTGSSPELADIRLKIAVQPGEFALDATVTARVNRIHLLIESSDTNLASDQVLLLVINSSAGQEIARTYTAIHTGIGERCIGRTALFNTEYDAAGALSATVVSAQLADPLTVPESDLELVDRCFAWAKQYDHQSSEIWQEWLIRMPGWLPENAHLVDNHTRS